MTCGSPCGAGMARRTVCDLTQESPLNFPLCPQSPNFDTSAICDTAAVTAMIQSHLPEAYLKEDIGGELVYVLPPFSTKVSGAYLSLLRALDKGMGKLNIGCYGISDTTVEEVCGQLLTARSISFFIICCLKGWQSNPRQAATVPLDFICTTYLCMSISLSICVGACRCRSSHAILSTCLQLSLDSPENHFFGAVYFAF